jgi:hypothetical protein
MKSLQASVKPMSMSLLCVMTICALVTILFPVHIAAQSALGSGRLEGTVLDPSGAVLPGATVTARNRATGISETKTSDADGHFVFLYLVPGTYEVSIVKSGFGNLLFKDVVVNVGTTASIRPHMTLGKVESEVTVMAAPPLVDPAQSSLSTVVGQQSIESLPLNGRDFTDFVLLTPGTTTDGEFGNISFHGLAGNYNNYTVDGGNNNNAFYAQAIGRGTIPFQFSQDIVQEFQVASTGFEAEFGQSGGGVVNTVTKSGGNQLHGDAYYYILDSALNANDSIDNGLGIPKPSNRRQQFGGTLGGPLVHDRLFYLGNYEGQVRNEPVTVNDAPALATLGDPTQQAAFLAANPALAAVLAKSSGSFPRSFNQNTAFFKLSGILNSKNTLNASYNFQRFRSPHGYFIAPTSTGDDLSVTDGATSHFFQFSLMTTFNPTAINELRLHFGNDLHLDLPPSPQAGPATIIQNPDSGFVFGGNRFQLSETDRRYEIADNFTKTLGKHTLKAGTDTNISHERDYFVYGPKGAYFFLNSLADVPNGNYSFYLQSFGQSTAAFTSPTYSLFLQDQFRATSRLTLNYGARYDLQVLPQPPVCNPDVPLTCKIPYSKHNVAPRAGFAYSLDQKGETVVRGAFGLFYIQEDLLDVSQAWLSNGISRPFLFVPGPGFGNTNPCVTYPNTVPSLSSCPGATQSLTVFAPKFRSPYVEQGDFAVERQLGSHTALSVGYVYSHGLALLGNGNGVTRQASPNGSFSFDLNMVPPALQPQFGGTFSTVTVNLPNGKSYLVPESEAIDGYINRNVGAINAVDNSGKSIYHALQVSLRHSSEQFSGALAYTFSKTIAQGTGYYNQFDQASQRGPSSLDQTHRLVLNGAWFPRVRPLKDFTLAAVANFASGRPYTAVFNNTAPNFSMVPGEGFNSFRGPGVQDFDFSVARDVKVSERVRLRFKAEAFDLFNHPNFQQSVVDNVQYFVTQRTDQGGNPLPIWDLDPTKGNNGRNDHFGKPGAIAPKYGSRNFQLSARITF